MAAAIAHRRLLTAVDCYAMRIIRRSKAIAFVIVLCSLLVAVAVALNITWILHWRGVAPLVIGILLFALIIAGLILNTIFLVREIRRNEQQDSFLNAVTHELRTPLASIRLHIDTLQSREITDEKRQEFYRIIREDTDRLMTAVDQVLRAAETVQAPRKQQWEPVDLVAIVTAGVNAARSRHGLDFDQLGSVRHELRPQEATILGDATELHTAISNVLDNAVKYSPDGVHITVDIKSRADELVVRISDKGLGIPVSELKRVFKRFYRAGRSRTKIKGSGLGLFIVHTIVRKHGGSVIAQSEGEGTGTSIVLRLPRRAAS